MRLRITLKDNDHTVFLPTVIGRIGEHLTMGDGKGITIRVLPKDVESIELVEDHKIKNTDKLMDSSCWGDYQMF